MLISPPGRPLVGRVRPPGSKSITNRALLLAALAGPVVGGGGPERSRLTGGLKSDDTRRMVEALRILGVEIDEPDDTTFVVRRRGPLIAPKAPLQLGNAGTAVRFLTAAAALIDGEVILDGDSAMRRRPIAPLLAALRQLGVDAEAPTGCPPVRVKGQGPLAGGRVSIDAGLSSQYVSALLMAAAMAEGPVEIALEGTDIGARGYVELTLAAMRSFGARIESLGPAAWRVAPTGYRPLDLEIEPDASSAVFLWVAERLTEGRIDLGLGPDAFTQPDAAAFPLISAFPHLPPVIDGAQIQDAVPALAVLAAFSAGAVRFVGVANLRVKECDRLAAVSAELCRLKDGLAYEDGDDLVVIGDPDLAKNARSASIKTYNDHRIAMSFALAGLRIQGVAIEDPACTAKTWPDFWLRMGELGAPMVLEDA